MAGVFIRREEAQAHTEGRWCENTQGEPHVITAVKTKVLHLRAKVCQCLLTTPEAKRKAQNSISPLEGNMALPTP